MVKSINPYLNFQGECEEAFKLYKSVFGGEFTMLQKFSEAPKEAGMPPMKGDGILHVTLKFGDNILIGSDAPIEMVKIKEGNNFNVSITAESEKEVDKIFNGLSKGGKVGMKLGKTFWGAYFGMCTDKFGINWMVSYEYPKK